VYVTATPEALDAGATVPQVAPLAARTGKRPGHTRIALSFATVAVNACVSPTVTHAVVSESVTPNGRRARVTVRWLFLSSSVRH